MSNKSPHRAAAIIINKPSQEILLMFRHKEGHDYVVLPGGHVEPYETSLQALEREIKEETSLEIFAPQKIRTIKNVSFNNQVVTYYLITKFSGTASLGGPEAVKNNSKDSYQLRWTKISTLPSLNLEPEDLKKWLIKYLDRLLTKEK